MKRNFTYISYLSTILPSLWVSKFYKKEVKRMSLRNKDKDKGINKNKKNRQIIK